MQIRGAREDARRRRDVASEPLEQKRLRQVDRGVEGERGDGAKQFDQEAVKNKTVGRRGEGRGMQRV
jgi:hypothetical protein